MTEVTVFPVPVLDPVGVVQELFMSRTLCTSDKESESVAEMLIHFSGLKNVDKPGVFVCARTLVCLVCGFSRLTVPRPELALLAAGTGTDETVAC